jgi:hypothetical protein
MCITHLGKQCSRKSLVGRRFCKQHDQALADKSSPKREKKSEKKSIRRNDESSRRNDESSREVKSINKIPKLVPKSTKSEETEVQTKPKSALRNQSSPKRGNISFNKNENVLVFERGIPGLVILQEKKSPTRSS